jgi:hypothetical protein
MKEEREKGSERKQLQGLRSMIQGDRVQLNRSHGRVSGGVIVVVVGEGDYCCCEGEVVEDRDWSVPVFTVVPRYFLRLGGRLEINRF